MILFFNFYIAFIIIFLETIATQGTVQQIGKPRPSNENIQPKQQANRPLNILPSNTANIRPASSVSTQTIGAQTPVSIHYCKRHLVHTN